MSFTLSNAAYRVAYQEWVDLHKWDRPYAVTLTFKQKIAFKKPSLGEDVYINPDIAAQNVSYFFHLLDRSSFGNHAARFDKFVHRFSVCEHTDAKNLHYHMAVNRPLLIADESFRFKIKKCWSKTIWGDVQMDIQSSANNGWIEYMMKPRDKADYQASVDILNTRF